MTQTPQNYEKYLQLITRRRHLFVIVALVIMAGAVLYSYQQPELYQARSTFFLEKSVISKLVQGVAAPQPDDNSRVLTYTMKSQDFLHRVVKELEPGVGKLNEIQLNSMVKDLQGRTDIKLQDKEGLFTVSFSHQDPVFARDYVNTLIRRYIDENVSSQREGSSDASRILEEQIAALKIKVDEADAGINSFKREKGGILADTEQNLVREIGEARQKLQEIGFKRSQLEAQRAVDPLSVRVAGLQKRLDDLQLMYTDSFPEVIKARTEMEAVKEEMKNRKAGMHSARTQESEKVSLELKMLRESEQTLKQLIASRQASMQEMPGAKASLAALEQEKLTHKTLYDQLVARQGQSEVVDRMEAQNKATSFRIVDPAIVPTKPVNPKRMKTMLMGILGGFAMSFGLLIILDSLDTSVRDLDTLKSLGVAVLAIVPKIEEPGELVVSRRRDLCFFLCTGAFFLLILGTLSLEVLRNFGFDIAALAQVKQNLAQLQNIR